MMKKPTKIIFGTFVLFLGVTISCDNNGGEVDSNFPSHSNVAEPAPTTTIQYESTFHDFGTINEGDEVKTVYKFTNTGNHPLIIKNTKASCGCTVPSKPEEPIMPGETGEIEVQFNSKGKPGAQSKTITVTANTAPEENTQLNFKAQVIPANKN